MAGLTTGAHAQAVADICSGLQVTLPVLQPVGNVASGVLGNVLDPVLNNIVGNINTNIGGALSGQNLGVTLFDRNGNAITLPGNCNVAADSVTVNANKGITVGGGRINGLGGPNSPVANAGEINSIALGNGAVTSNAATNSIAIGLRGTSTAVDGVALGRDSNVSAAGGIALGAGSSAARVGLSGGNELFSGTSIASTAGALSIGAVGGERQITNVAGGTAATDAVNVRQLRTVGGNLASSFGGGAQFDTTTGLYTGPTYSVHGVNYGDVGSAISALNTGVVATNLPFAANNTSGLANPTAAGADALAVGYGATSSGDRSASFGTRAAATGTDTSAFGADAAASGARSTAVGNGAIAAGDASVAAGAGSSAAGVGSVAVGQNASAGQNGSVAIGNGAATVRNNQVALGGAQSTYTLAGVASRQSLAAQSGPTRFVTADSAGNLATSSFDPNALLSQFSSLSGSVDSLRRESRQGIASAMALTSAPMPSLPGKTSWALNTANFKGEWGTGFSVAHRLNAATPIAVTAGYTTGGGTTHAGRVGLAGEF